MTNHSIYNVNSLYTINMEQFIQLYFLNLGRQFYHIFNPHKLIFSLVKWSKWDTQVWYRYGYNFNICDEEIGFNHPLITSHYFVLFGCDKPETLDCTLSSRLTATSEKASTRLGRILPCRTCSLYMYTYKAAENWSIRRNHDYKGYMYSWTTDAIDHCLYKLQSDNHSE